MLTLSVTFLPKNFKINSCASKLQQAKGGTFFETRWTYVDAADCYRPGSVVCQSVCRSVAIVSRAERLSRSRCRLGWGLGWVKRTMCRMGRLVQRFCTAHRRVSLCFKTGPSKLLLPMGCKYSDGPRDWTQTTRHCSRREGHRSIGCGNQAVITMC